MNTLVEVDGVFACYDIFQCATLTGLPQTMSCQPYNRWKGRGENGELDGPSSCLSSRRGTVDILQNTISTRNLWNNGHEFSVAAGGAVSLLLGSARLLPGPSHVERFDFLMDPSPPREVDWESLTIYGEF